MTARESSSLNSGLSTGILWKTTQTIAPNLSRCLSLNLSMYACVHACRHFSHGQLFATLWTVAHQAPLSMDSLGKNTGVVASPPSGELPDLGIKLTSLAFPALAGRFFTTCATWEGPLSPYA